MKLFSVHDSKAAHYENPMVFKTTEEALRAFAAISKDPKTKFGTYPSDFTLIEVGSFDPDTCAIKTLDTPHILANGSEFIQ